jgi:hypothetical protein
MLCLIDILRESDGGGRGVDTVSKDVWKNAFVLFESVFISSAGVGRRRPTAAAV